MTIFPISIGWSCCGNIAKRIAASGCRKASPAWGCQLNRWTTCKRDNEMRTFAAMTGGRAYFPRFQASLARLSRHFRAISAHQYTHCLRPHQYETRRHLPQTESAGGGAGRRPAESERPEGQRREDRSRCQGWVYGEAHGGLINYVDSVRNGGPWRPDRIPVAIRRKFQIVEGTHVAFVEEDARLFPHLMTDESLMELKEFLARSSRRIEQDDDRKLRMTRFSARG